MTTRSGLILRTLGITSTVIYTTVALAACSMFPSSSATSTESTATKANTTQSTSATPTPQATTDAVISLGKNCDQLVSLDALYSFNPNYSADPNFKSSSVDVAKNAVALGGTACGYINLTSDEKVTVAVAKLTDAKTAQTAADITAAGGSTDVYGAGQQSFSSSNGTAQLLDNNYWIVVQSSAFLDPKDASGLMTSVMNSLGL